jgi:hypothetical protein
MVAYLLLLGKYTLFTPKGALFESRPAQYDNTTIIVSYNGNVETGYL